MRTGRGRRKMWLASASSLNLRSSASSNTTASSSSRSSDLLHALGWERDLCICRSSCRSASPSSPSRASATSSTSTAGRPRPASACSTSCCLMSFFPHLVAGPIVRASDLMPQFDSAPRADRGMAAMGLLLIVWGLFKKTMIASELAIEPGRSGLLRSVGATVGARHLVAGAYGYAVQIYCDFSAYSDMAIGIAALLGYRFPRNFDQPYRARLAAGFLAALAHQPVELAARLSLRVAGRRPQGPRPALCIDADDHHAAGRPVARGELDLRDLGRAARRRCSRSSGSGVNFGRSAGSRCRRSSASSSPSTSSCSAGSSSARRASTTRSPSSAGIFSAGGRRCW